MTTVQVMYWHHIPTQLKARGEDGREVRKPLPDRFMAAVDAAAMHHGLADTDAYLAGWRWGPPETHPGTPEEAARGTIERIVQRFEGRAIPLTIDSEDR